MPMLRRQIMVNITIDGLRVQTFFGFRITHSLADAVSRAQIVVPYPYGRYDSPVVIRAGALPGNGLALRFKGRRRKTNMDLFPRACTIECVGELSKVAEYINWEDGIKPSPDERQPIDELAPSGFKYGPVGVGGLRIQDLVPNSTHPLKAANLSDIAVAVFEKAGLAYKPENIRCSGRKYGGGLDRGYRFIWRAGTTGLGPNAQNQQDVWNSYRRAGESGLSYIQKFCQIDAQYVVGDQTTALTRQATQKIGFFRIFEVPNGDVMIQRVGGPPDGYIDLDINGRMLIFTEGGSIEIPFPAASGTPNILTANFNKDFPIANRSLVTGYDLVGFQMHNEAAVDIPTLMPISTYHYDPSPPSSDWIDWSTAGPEPGGGYESQPGPPEARYGMDCQTVAQARLTEVARETITGNLTTASDAVLAPGQVHLIQGPAGYLDRLWLNDPLWCQGNDFELEIRDGAPVLTQTPTYVGGGKPGAPGELPDNVILPPP